MTVKALVAVALLAVACAPASPAAPSIGARATPAETPIPFRPAVIRTPGPGAAAASAPAVGVMQVAAPEPDGACPADFPVKAFKTPSYRYYYRLPGDPDYDRTPTDVCYATAEAAEAEGYFRDPFALLTPKDGEA